jgi:DNA processing protein
MLESEYLTAVYAFNYFGPARVKLLLSYFKTPKKIWKSTKEELTETGLSEKKVLEFEKFRKDFDIENYFSRLKKLKIEVTTVLDKNFPKNLKGLDGAPLLLYYKGSLDCLKANCVAIVGTRKMTAYGREVTQKFSSELANFGITIISGLAYGVDTAAHKGCLSVGGKTAAVLGNGLDTIYPTENTGLANEIIKTGGAVISEFPLGYPSLPVNFAIRNRIVSGLSDAVIVVEGAEKSGTLLTATHAAEQGKTVFAIPGQITSPLSFAPLFLLKNGAKLATEVKDVLDELDMQVKVDKEKIAKIIPDTPEEEKLLTILENEPLHLDELVRISGCKTQEISARLTIMEMKGMVRSMGNGIYKKCN